MPAPVPLRQPWYVARPLLTCLGVFIAAPVLFPDLAASGMVVRNLSVDQELLPANFDYEIDDGVLTRSGSDSFDQVIGLAVGAWYSFASAGDSHGFLIGGQITVAQGADGSVGHLTDYGLRIEGGHDLTGSGVDATIALAGLSARQGFLYRLSNQPSLLE